MFSLRVLNMFNEKPIDEVLQTLQGQERANSQHHQKGKGGHQNPQGRLLPCGTNSRQGGSPW